MHLCAIALHPYHGIAHPLRMRSGGARQHRRVAALVAPAWTVAVALSVPFVVQGILDPSYVLAPDELSDPTVSPPGERLSCGIFNRTFAVYSSLVSFFIPLAIMVFADFRSVQILRYSIRFPLVEPPSASDRRRYWLVGSGSRAVTPSCDCDFEDTAPHPSRGTAAITGDHLHVVDQADRTMSRGAATSDSVTSQRQRDVGFETAPPSSSVPPSGDQYVYRGRSRSKSMIYIDMLASCGSVKLNGRERRAEKTLIWVFAAFVALWLPFFCANLTYGLCGLGEKPSCDVLPTLFAVFTWLGYLSSGINPCIYTLLNRDFRTAFRYLVTCRHARLRTAGSSALRCSGVYSARGLTMRGRPSGDVITINTSDCVQ
jgi:hypothetical protein